MPTVHFILPEGPQRGARTVYRPVLPRGVLQIARAAEAAGWQATVLDGYSAPHLVTAYLEVLAQDGGSSSGGGALPELVGISVHGPPAIEPALAIAARLREIEPSLPLLFGGQLANADAELLLPLLPERSILISGDGDAAIADVLQEALAANGEARLIRRPGLHPWHSLPDLDLLLPRYADYFGEADFEYHLETQIGCPYRCFHCGTGRKGLYARTMNRPLEAIHQELDYLAACAGRLGLPHPSLWITDETFGSDPEHAIGFCQTLISRPESWTWRAQSRADVISEDLLAMMREAGCRRLAFGVEIPNDDGLDLLGKREAMKAVEEAFALCRRQGISPEAIVVVGTPGDPTRPEEFLDALEHLGAESVQAYIYHPIPGSPWWKKYGEDIYGRSDSQRRWADLDFHSPPLDASSDEVERAIIAFLALQSWRPNRKRVPATSGLRKQPEVQCSRCGGLYELQRVFADSGTEIYKISSTGEVYYIVSTPDDVKVLELDPNQHRNLYCGLFSVEWPSLDLLCPRCLLNEGRFLSPASANEGASFLAI